jgi:predicted Zn-dependent peptidase
MSSRLFIEAREKRGLCYSIFSAVSTYEDTGDLMIKAGLDANRLEPALKLIISELKKLTQKGITVQELKKAKDFVKGSTILSLEDSEAQAAWYAREIIYGEKIQTPTSKLKQLEKVTVAQVNDAAKTIFKSSKLNLALIGSVSAEQKAKLFSFLSI